MSDKNQSFSQQSWVGIAVMVIGALFLVQSLGILHFGHFLGQWWPLVIVLLGVWKMRNEGGQNGLIVLIVGLVLLSATLNFINWGVIFRFWPLIIVLAGWYIFSRKSGDSLIKRGEVGEDFIKVSAIFGGMNRVVTSEEFKGADVLALFGGVELDLRKAKATEGCEIHVTSLFGGAEIFVPSDWKVTVKGTPIFGGIEDKTGGGDDKGTPVTLVITAAFGGVEIRD